MPTDEIPHVLTTVSNDFPISVTVSNDFPISVTVFNNDGV